MAQWFHNEFARSRVFGPHTASATEITLPPGEGLRFPTAPRQLVIWDADLWEDWVAAFYDTPAAVEIIHQLTPGGSDILPSVLRARSGTTALNMTDTTHEYRIQAVQTDLLVATLVRTAALIVNPGHVEVESSAWNAGHVILGAYHIWVDATGDLRIKNGAPSSDTDGTVVGTQT